MEAVEDPPLHNSSIDNMKTSIQLNESDEKSEVSIPADVCHKSNGVAESADSVDKTAEQPEKPSAGDAETELETTSTEVVDIGSENVVEEPPAPSTSSTEKVTDAKEDLQEEIVAASEMEVIKEESEDTKKPVPVKDSDIEETVVAVDNIVEPINDRVTFQTEILIETNDNDLGENVLEETKVCEEDTASILSELGENIELNEALRSSDVAENVKNNNCTVRQEVFNKEELLDILEGNDEEMPSNLESANLQNLRTDKMLEAQLALQQLSRLKRKSKKTRSVERQSKGKKSEKKVVKQSVPNNTAPVKKEESLVNVLVQEWEDDEPAGTEQQSAKLVEESEKLLTMSSKLVEDQENVTKHEEVSVRTSIDSNTTDEKPTNLNKTGDENQPQRRLGRVIKKKVIFDPDNPDTFTKSKAPVKSKEAGQENDQPVPKKNKSEQSFQRSKSKSPISKLQWKKPSPKNCKQNKRLTEIDRLLMDEGAVNMIYQLTPEAPKGKKNMKTKAEFIKKIQSSTPDSKEMKFRERKKESKYEENEAKRILGGKQRPSLSSSVKSPSVCEDFEAHSADDSIIYRRHSSSSYSSSCMSPRRLSDVEGSGQPVARNLHNAEEQNQASNDGNGDRPSMDVFMSDNADSVRTDIINKDDCLSIKQKLNSKLILALNKRKREISKGEKPSKIKKITKSDDKIETESENFKYLSVLFDDKLAEICIRKTGSKCSIEVIKELEKALTLVDARTDISVTLLTSECGTLCSDLDLRALVDNDTEKRTNFANDTAESIRSLLQSMQSHGKLICTGVNGRCSGVALAMIGLSDITIASDRASFSISQKSHGGTAPVVPGVAVLSAYRLLPQSLLNDLVIFGRRLSASEALQSGLVSRTLWPERFYEQVRAIAKDITTQSMQNILLKKQLLTLRKSGSESTFLSCLDRERDLLVEYWTSTEGQELLRMPYAS